MNVDENAREANHHELVQVYLVVQGAQTSVLI